MEVQGLDETRRGFSFGVFDAAGVELSAGRNIGRWPLCDHYQDSFSSLPAVSPLLLFSPSGIHYFHTKRTVLLLVSLVSGPRKRPRVPMDDPGGTNGTEDGGQEQRKRDAQFWYEDGTVILVAHDVEFRVYKGVLVQHSLFFRDMFSLPQPPDAASEPCPTVHLFDSPEDIRYMLQASMMPGSPRCASFRVHAIQKSLQHVSAYFAARSRRSTSFPPASVLRTSTRWNGS